VTQLIIRPEVPADYAAVSRVVAAAFGRPNEARLVERLRETPGYLPELSLVAEERGAITGHVMFTYVTLDDNERGVLCLAPVSVAPERQKDGIGGALIREGVARAGALGEPLVVLVGHPAYYPRFGFEPAQPLGLQPPPGTHDAVFMALRLFAYDAKVRGRVAWPAVFEETGTA
jgi:putative acetyltransferase